MEWSYDYAEKRHANIRAKREDTAGVILDNWLRMVVGPHVDSSAPLPSVFTGLVQNDLDRSDIPVAVARDELVPIAAKLGWTLEMSFVSGGINVRFAASHSTPRAVTNSMWDFEAVRTRNQRNSIAQVQKMIRLAVDPHLGLPGGMPGVFPVLGVTDRWMEQHATEFAVLGWSIEATSSHWQLRKI